MSNNNLSSKKIESFFKKSIQYYGKEIGLASNQYFSIEQICDPEEEKNDEFSYMIQYGFPQSGCVSMRFKYLQKENKFAIDEITIHAPAADKDIAIANFSSQTQANPIGIGVNFGIDMKTKKHSSIKEIEENPNALKMLNIAISDLSNAKILGECTMAVPQGSNRIPCCNSTAIYNEEKTQHKQK